MDNEIVVVSSIRCKIAVAPFTGNAYHIVSWRTEDGLGHSQSIHGCYDAADAIGSVLAGFPCDDEEAFLGLIIG